MNQAVAPFRHDPRDPLLGQRLGPGPSISTTAEFKKTLLECALSVLREAGDTDLVIVGRSPENLYDFLSGLFQDTSWRDRVQLLQLSLGWERTPGRLRRDYPGGLAQLWSYFDSLRLTPGLLLARPRPVSFVDLVSSGQTLGNLQKLLRHWCRCEPRRWPAVRARTRWVCIVKVGDPDARPWDPEDSSWTEALSASQVRRVSLHTDMWRYLGEEQLKSTDSYRAERWDDPDARRPPLDDRLPAARLARALFRLGGWSRKRVALKLEGTLHEGWARDLIRELRAATLVS